MITYEIILVLYLYYKYIRKYEVVTLKLCSIMLSKIIEIWCGHTEFKTNCTSLPSLCKKRGCANLMWTDKVQNKLFIPSPIMQIIEVAQICISPFLSPYNYQQFALDFNSKHSGQKCIFKSQRCHCYMLADADYGLSGT